MSRIALVVLFLFLTIAACGNVEDDMKVIENIISSVMHDQSIEEGVKAREIYKRIMDSAISRKTKAWIELTPHLQTFDYRDFKRYMRQEGYPDWESDSIKKFFPVQKVE
jgi:hypothetical protein